MTIEFEGPLTAGQGISLASLTGSGHLPEAGYVEEEHLATGEVRCYRAVGELGYDGRWAAEPAGTATVRTRVIVRRPADGTRFNGTVVVEWLNVSAGFDSGPDWMFLEPELMRRGCAWVGVSAQEVGVSGGDSLVGLGTTGGLVGADPERYASLTHPGDAFSYDLFAQIGRALRNGPIDGGSDPLAGARPFRLLAVGESQSAFRLTGYLNAVHRRDEVFDGFLVHSRIGFAADLGEDSRLTSSQLPIARIRDDLEVPVMIVETETDLGPRLNYLPARQPDGERLRLWEIAGTAHADAHFLGGAADLMGCSHLVNDGPQRFVVRAALRHLDRWVAGESAPPCAPRLSAVTATGDTPPTVVRDGHGNALGGIRTPLVDVPVSMLTGEPPACDNPICFLFGSTVPFDTGRLAATYPDAAAYTAAYAQAADDAIAAGFVLEEDRAELLAAGQAAWHRAATTSAAPATAPATAR